MVRRNLYIGTPQIPSIGWGHPKYIPRIIHAVQALLLLLLVQINFSHILQGHCSGIVCDIHTIAKVSLRHPWKYDYN